MPPFLSTKRAFIFFLTLLAAQFPTGAAQSKTEQLGMLEGGWGLARDQAQGRCVIQSPVFDLKVSSYEQDKGFMLINIKRADPQELVFTFSREGWASSDEKFGSREGYLSIFTEPFRTGLILDDNPRKKGPYVPGFGYGNGDVRIPIWPASNAAEKLRTYRSSQEKTVFVTIISPSFVGMDPETGKAVSLPTLLADQKYSTDKMGLWLEFKDTYSGEDDLPDFAIPLSLIPDISPLLECIK